MATVELFQRHPLNPILSSKVWPYPINAVFNAGACLYQEKHLLLCRVEDRRGISHLTVASSKDGFKKWHIENRPTLAPEPKLYPEEEWGLEDPRVIKLHGEKDWIITYTSFSFRGPAVSLAQTTDFKHFKRIGVILPPENKDVALFDRKIKDKYWMIHRPVSRESNMWIASSNDLKHWGNHQMLMRVRHGSWWDASKIGISPPPLYTPKGWLVAYHSGKTVISGVIYRIGLALLDLDDPTKVMRRSAEWVLSPQEAYERTGDIPNVVFSCGWIHEPKEETLRMYYGSSDSCIGVATAKVPELLDYLLLGKSNIPKK